MNLSRIIAVSCSLAFASASFAQVYTIDGSSLNQLKTMIVEQKMQLKEMLTQNVKLDEQTLKLIEQIKQAEAIYDQLSDGFDLADLGIGPDFLDDILPEIGTISESFDAAMSGDWGSVLKSGSVGGTDVATKVAGIFDGAGLEKSTVDDMAASGDKEGERVAAGANTGAWLSVAAEASAEQAQESLERVDMLMAKQSEADTLKKAIDLNTRVTAELAVALANVWQMEAAQTIGQGQMGVMDAATLADEVKYLDLNGDGK